MNDEETVIDGYKIIYQMNIGTITFFIGEKSINEMNSEYITGRMSLIFGGGIKVYSVHLASENYQDVLNCYLSDINQENSKVINEQKERPKGIVMSEDCHSIYDYQSLIGKVVVLKPDTLYKQYQNISNQLYLADGGFGCNPKGSGNAIFAINLYTEETSRIEKYELLGVMKEEKLSEWAKEKLKTIKKSQKEKSKGMER